MKAALDGEFDPRSIDALSKQLLSEPLLKVRNFAAEIANALTQSGKGSLLEALIPYKRAKNLTIVVKADYNVSVGGKLEKVTNKFNIESTKGNLKIFDGEA